MRLFIVHVIEDLEPIILGVYDNVGSAEICKEQYRKEIDEDYEPYITVKTLNNTGL